MNRLLERIKDEPQLIGSLILVILNIAAAFGLELTPEQRNAVLSGVPVILGIGFGIRSQVKPVRKIRREDGQLKPFDPDLRARRGRQR